VGIASMGKVMISGSYSICSCALLLDFIEKRRLFDKFLLIFLVLRGVFDGEELNRRASRI